MIPSIEIQRRHVSVPEMRTHPFLRVTAVNNMFRLRVDGLTESADVISDDGKTIFGVQYTQPPMFWRVVL